MNRAWLAVVWTWVLACNPQQVAPQVAQVDTQQVIPITSAVCALAPDSPVGQPWVDVVCQLVEAGEQLVATIASAVGGEAGMASTTTQAPVVSVRLRIPAASAEAFLAAHKGKR